MRLRGNVGRAKILRRKLTPPEVRLWVRLRRRAADDLHFRRQHPRGPYILDFFCAGAKLAVEVDGFIHDTGMQPMLDTERDAWLTAQGIMVFRIAAKAVLEDADSAADLVLGVAHERLQASR